MVEYLKKKWSIKKLKKHISWGRVPFCSGGSVEFEKRKNERKKEEMEENFHLEVKSKIDFFGIGKEGEFNGINK